VKCGGDESRGGGRSAGDRACRLSAFLPAGELSTGSSRTVLLEKGEAFLDFLSETPFDLNYPVTKLGKRDHRGANI
jgi:hypothetical protein